MLTEGVGAMIKTHVDQTVRIEKSLKSLVSFISFKTIVGFLLLHSFCYFCEVVRSEAASGKPVATTSAAEKVEWQGINLVEISASSVVSKFCSGRAIEPDNVATRKPTEKTCTFGK